MSFAMNGFGESASPAVCRRVPGIRPKRNFLHYLTQKEVNGMHCGGQRFFCCSLFIFQSTPRHWHGPLLRQPSSYPALVERTGLLLDLLRQELRDSDSCSDDFVTGNWVALSDKEPQAADSSQTAIGQEILLRHMVPISTAETGFSSCAADPGEGGKGR